MTKDTIEQVALVSGVVLNRGTRLPIDGSVVFEAHEGPVASKVLEDGTFVVSGQPEILFPGLAAGPCPLTLTVRAHSSEFTQGEVDHPLLVTVAAAFPFISPLDQGDLLLPVNAADIQNNLARTIRGRVMEAADPLPSVPGATVDILQGGLVTNTAITDADGRFGFDDLVVVAPAQIRCTAATFKGQTRTLLIDFHLSMHEETFRLAPV